MKIGVFAELFYPYMLGGVEQRCYEIAKRLVSLGDEVTVFSTSLAGIDSEEDLLNDKLKIIRTGLIRNPINYRRRFSFLTFAPALLKYIDVLKSFDVLDFNQFCGLPGELLTRLSRVPHILTIHDIPRLRIARSDLLLACKMMACLHDDGCIVAVSYAVRDKLVRYFKVDPGRIVVVPNGVDLHTITRVSKKASGEGRMGSFRLVYVGRLVRSKNVDHIFLALKHLDEMGYKITLDVIGSGKKLHHLQELSVRLGLDESVNFLGFVDDKLAVYKHMARADLFVSPSTFEGFGITLLESMAAGTPVVAYDLPAYRDFMKNHYNGMLVEPNNITKLVHAIRTVLDDPSLSSRLVTNGLRTAQKYDIAVIVEKLREIYLNSIHEWRSHRITS